MHKRHFLTLLWLALYLAAAYAASRTEYFLFWQVLVLLLPSFALLTALAWTRPDPDYSAAPDIPSEPIEDMANPARKTIWLDGHWDFKIEKESRWRRVMVPRPWNVIPGLEHYSGMAEYRRIVSVPEDWSQGNVFLNFRGVNYRSTISIDGRPAGTHEGGFTPFSVDVTDRLTPGRESELVVSVDNKLTETTVPNVLAWNNDGGILREVYLETCNPIYIDDVYVMSTPDLKGRASVVLMVKINNIELKPKDYRIEIFSPQGALIHEHVVEGWSIQTLQHRLQVNFASLWSPESPMLYRCRVAIDEEGGDEVSVEFGIRSFEVGESGYLLNGEPYRIRGTSRLEESTRLGRTQTQDTIRQDLEKVKAAGFNTIRLAAFPAHPKTLEFCDRIGLLVLEELPTWNTMVIDLADPGYQQAAEAQLREMVSRDRNHPSVVMWGVANKIESDSSEARWFVDRLAGLARGLDDRLIYLITSKTSDELCADLVDCIVLSLQVSEAGGMQAVVGRANYGPSTIAFHRGLSSFRPPGTRFAGSPGTEEYQANFCTGFIDTFDGDPRVSGWILAYLADYRDPSNLAGSVPFVNTTGLMKRDRNEKLAYPAVTRRLKEGRSPRLPSRRLRIPVTSFTKITTAVFTFLFLVLFAFNAGPSLKLAYNPAAFVDLYPRSWLVVICTSLYSSVSLAVIINRFFRMAPRRILGSFDMHYFNIVSFIFRSEVTLFAFTYGAILYLWMFSTTLLHLILRDSSFIELLNYTSAISLPQMLFVIPAFLRVRFRYALVVFNLWMIYLAYIVLGPWGAAIYIIVGPAFFIVLPVLVIERKFRILKYMGKMLRAN